MKRLLRMIFVGPQPPREPFIRSAIPNQKHNLKTVWRNRPVVTFGVERIFRLLLILTGYLFVGLYVRHFTGKRGHLARKIGVDIYVLCKLVVPILILIIGTAHFSLLWLLAAYLGIETLHYNLNLLFLSDIYISPFSVKRSYIMTLLNYVELCLEFAVIYSGLRILKGIHCAFDAVYFSFVAAFTLGDGDIGPMNNTGKAIIILQCLCSLLLVTLVFTRIVSGFDGGVSPRNAGNLLRREPEREHLPSDANHL